MNKNRKKHWGIVYHPKDCKPLWCSHTSTKDWCLYYSRKEAEEKAQTLFGGSYYGYHAMKFAERMTD
jgi:hypothetical protein